MTGQERHEQDQALPEHRSGRERPDWLWKIIAIIAALVLLQVLVVWWFWVRL